jgi:hypothetical protein
VPFVPPPCSRWWDEVRPVRTPALEAERTGDQGLSDDAQGRIGGVLGAVWDAV